MEVRGNYYTLQKRRDTFIEKEFCRINNIGLINIISEKELGRKINYAG